MVWTNKKTLQTLGILLIIFGVLLILIALFSSTVTNQCPPGNTPCVYYVPMYWTGFILGIALVVIGIILLLAERRMKPEEESDR